MFNKLASLLLLLSASASVSAGLQAPRAIKLTHHHGPRHSHGHEKRGTAVELENLSIDRWYRLEFKVGTPEQTVEAVLDSMAPVSSLYGRHTEEDRAFQSNKSSTFKPLPPNQGSEAVALDRAVDRITMGDDTREDVPFYYNNDPVNGDSWGFGIPSPNESEPDTSFWQVASKEWADPRMGMFLSRHREEAKAKSELGKTLDYKDSEIMTGGVNQDKYTGEIHMYAFQTGARGGWPIPLEAITVNGKEIRMSVNHTRVAKYTPTTAPTTASPEAVEALLSTASQSIYGPEEVIGAIYANIPGAGIVPRENNMYNATWQFPCNTTGISVSLTIGGHSYKMDARDMIAGWIWPGDRGGAIRIGQTPNTGMCAGAFATQTRASDGWEIGTSFLRNVYTVFDFNTPAVGFAQLATDAQPNVKGSWASPVRDVSSVVIAAAVAMAALL